jgi:two-component system phosphate regulon sensor histidine kinase PhoR
MKPQAERSGLDLSITLRSGEDSFPLALADPERLIQVLINLIHNGIKFTPVGGSITLSVERYGTDKLLVKVSDTGVGIPPDDLTRVFERFYKVDKARAGAEAGTGLGLAIAKHVIQAHNGEIWVESDFGSGSSFIFTIPIFSIY